MCYSDLMSSQVFNNLCKSLHVDRCQFNYQWSNYLIGYTFCQQSKGTFLVIEKQERHIPFNFIRQWISKFFEDLECALHIHKPIKMPHWTSHPDLYCFFLNLDKIHHIRFTILTIFLFFLSLFFFAIVVIVACALEYLLPKGWTRDEIWHWRANVHKQRQWFPYGCFSLNHFVGKVSCGQDGWVYESGVFCLKLFVPWRKASLK